MKILHVTPFYHPATCYGGPIFSTLALCDELARLPDVELRVLTCDMAGPRVSDRVPVSAFPMRFPAGYEVYVTRRVMWPDIAPGLVRQIGRMVGWADAVMLTQAYSFPTIPTLIACRLADKPIAWGPHGSLLASHQWADVPRRRLKRAWETICRLAKPRRCVLHVTSEPERVASCARLPEFEAVVIANGAHVPEGLPMRSWRPGGLLRLMFLGRVHPIKGLDLLLQALPQIPHATLDVYGAGEESYVLGLHRLARQLGIAGRVSFHGPVEGEAKRMAFLNADIFVLPTHSENFGMVVAEALAHGVPAIVSEGAPWSGLDAKGCGRWVSNSPQAIAEAIRSLEGMDLEAMGARGRRWMVTDFSWRHRAEEMKSLFERLIAS